MKRKPIQNPDYWMDGLYKVTPPRILNRNRPLDGDSLIYMNEKPFIIDRKSIKSVKKFTETYKNKLGSVDCAEIMFDSAFHDETYEYNKEDGKWYLVDQGKGYA